MVASTDIKFYVHTNNNAPQLQNAYGSMINVLDACLINGFQIGVVNSLTASGNTVTASFGAAHNLMQYQVIKITGATQTEYNGEHRILTVPNANTITFELAAAPSVSTATGTISASLPPLGWEKPFSSSNPNGGGKAAYRSTNLLLPSRPFLRVVDELDPAYTATYAKYAKVGIVEDMTGINEMSGTQQPYDYASPNKNWAGTGSGTSAYNGWAKWHYAKNGLNTSANAASAAVTNGNREWFVVGSGDYFYILNNCHTVGTFLTTYGFGSFESFLNVDNFNVFLAADINYEMASSGFYASQVLCGSLSTSMVRTFRSYKGEEGLNRVSCGSINPANQTIYSGANDGVANVATMGYVCFSDVFFIETGSILRGKVPGLYWLFQNQPLRHKTIFEKNGGLYIALQAAYSSTQCMIVLKIGEIHD